MIIPKKWDDMNKEEKFVELYSFLRIQNYNVIANKIDISRGYVPSLYAKAKPECDKIQEVFRRYYNKQKSAGNDFHFKDFREFYNWYIAQPRTCHYCGIPEQTLFDLYDRGILHSKRTTRGKSLEIERLNSQSNSYNKDNCVLSCYFCNNHKSDIISEDDHKKYFIKAIRNYLEDKLEAGKNSR